MNTDTSLDIIESPRFMGSSEFLLGNRLLKQCSLAGGGKTYIRRYAYGKKVYKLDYDHLGNLLIREASQSFWGLDKGNKKTGLVFNFYPPYMLFNKFEVTLIKRARRRLIDKNKKERNNVRNIAGNNPRS
jgi:hypothetical protein